MEPSVACFCKYFSKVSCSKNAIKLDRFIPSLFSKCGLNIHVAMFKDIKNLFGHRLNDFLCTYWSEIDTLEKVIFDRYSLKIKQETN